MKTYPASTTRGAQFGALTIVALIVAPFSSGAQPDQQTIEKQIATAVNSVTDTAERWDEKAFDWFSTSSDMRFASEGMVRNLDDFPARWREATARSSWQFLSDREIAVQVLSADVADSALRATYNSARRWERPAIGAICDDMHVGGAR